MNEITANTSEGIDIAIVGGGAAGLATAIFVARKRPGLKVVVLDGARTLGAKILVSGGSRCNVTNRRVDAGDFWRADSRFVKHVLRALSVGKTVEFFEQIGVELKEEPLGKMFPVTNRARTVLDALLRECARCRVSIRTSHRVTAIARTGPPAAGREPLFRVAGPGFSIESRFVVLATGGLSLPKTGSDGAGYAFAEALGHTLVPRAPALEPLILEGSFHAPLAGVSHEASITVKPPREAESGQSVTAPARSLPIEGSILWTHFGVSGPLALDASRFARSCSLSLSFVPRRTAEDIDRALMTAARGHGAVRIDSLLASPAFGLKSAVAAALTERAGLAAAKIGGARLTRQKRRELVSSLVAFPLHVVSGRGYNFAEVTSGGVTLEDVDPRTMESRRAPGLYFAGEILDVDGRIGGFNFQWAWCTAAAAAAAMAGATARG
jgi:hypothetical protein